MALARSEGSPQRFHSMSAEVRQERKDDYTTLGRTQKDDLEITDCALWFLACLDRAIDGAKEVLGKVLHTAAFWRMMKTKPRGILRDFASGREL